MTRSLQFCRNFARWLSSTRGSWAVCIVAAASAALVVLLQLQQLLAPG